MQTRREGRNYTKNSNQHINADTFKTSEGKKRKHLKPVEVILLLLQPFEEDTILMNYVASVAALLPNAAIAERPQRDEIKLEKASTTAGLGHCK